MADRIENITAFYSGRNTAASRRSPSRNISDSEYAMFF